MLNSKMITHMNKYKLTHGLLALALLAVPMISCTDSVMDDINVDKNHAQDVQAKFIVTDFYRIQHRRRQFLYLCICIY